LYRFENAAVARQQDDIVARQSQLEMQTLVGIAQDIGRLHAWVFNPKQGKTQPINVTPGEKQFEFQIVLSVYFLYIIIFF